MDILHTADDILAAAAEAGISAYAEPGTVLQHSESEGRRLREALRRAGIEARPYGWGATFVPARQGV